MLLQYVAITFCFFAADIFNVTVVENVSAERCHMKGIYELHISTENFSIVDKTTNKRLYTWPFRHVRRYGRSSTNFQFEAGRKCSSGIVVLSFDWSFQLDSHKTDLIIHLTLLIVS